MKVLDEKFVTTKLCYLLQCILVSSLIFIILLILDAKSNGAIISALGAGDGF